MVRTQTKQRSKFTAESSVDHCIADQELAGLAKALGHAVRVRIVRLLAQRKSCVCGELVGELPVAQSTVSQHLKILKQAGLIRGTIDGPRICYCLEPAALQRLRELINDLPEPRQESDALARQTQDCR